MNKGNFSHRRRSWLQGISGRHGSASNWTGHRPLLEILEQRAMLAGWTTIAASGSGPSAGQTMQLLSNGTVMVESAAPQVNTNWFALTPGATGNGFPDTGAATGNYVNGAWSSLASMNEGRAFFPAALLPNGEDYVLGGEYSSPDPFTNTAEIYNPVTNTWSYVAPAPTPSTNVDLTAKITGASNTSPITITTTNTGVLSPGEQVTVSGVLGNTAANGTWTISNITGTGFDLNGSTGNGSYTSGGSWSAFKPQYGDDPIEVLNNGDVLAGYFNSPTTYLYNPSTNTWTTTANTKLHNDRSDEETWIKLADGSILSYDIYSSSSGTFQAQRYVPSTGLWTDASGINGADPPSILSDPGSAPNGGEGAELGPAFLLPNGNAIFFGANGNTAVFNPTTNQWSAGPAEPSKNFSGSINGATNAGPITITTGSTAGLQNGEAVTISGVGGNTAANGTWVITNLTGTSFQLLNSNGNGSYTSGGTWSVGQLVMADAPGAIMPNGDILLVMSPLGGIGANGNYTFPKTAYAYEFDPTTGVYTEVTPAGGLPSNSNFYYMVNLPSGQIMMDGNDGFAGIYTPAAGPLDSWRPVITGIQNNNDGTFTLRGTQLTGISEGSSFGDDYESATNYPILQLTDFSGNVYYAKTYNWSTTNVQTGSTPESATFTLPAGTNINQFATATVVANGIESQPAQLLDLDNSDESLVIRVNPSDSTDIQVLVYGTGQEIADYPNNSASPIQVFGDGNNNLLVVDETYGNVNTPINFDGGGSTGAPGDRMLVVGSSGNDQLVVTPQTPTSSTMSFNGSAPYTFTNIQQFGYYGAGGNDNMTVDSSMSLSSVPMLYDGDNGFSQSAVTEDEEGFPIQFAPSSGGNGFNTLTLTQTGGSQTSDTYSVGPNNGEGSSVIAGGGVTQTVDFQNLAPVVDTVPTTTFTVNATPSSNAINYSNANDGTGNGVITIDNQESIEFANKATLNLNGGAGDDTINLNYQPTTLGAGDLSPPGLTQINVDGGDPTASDTLIYNGVSGLSDRIIVTPTAVGAGTITDSFGASATPVGFTDIENISVVGQAADNDSFGYYGTTGNDAFTYSPGATPFSGTVTGFFTGNGAGNYTFTPVQFSGIASQVVLDTSPIFTPGPVGGTDTVTVNGATGGNTTFDLSTLFGPTADVQLNGDGPLIQADPAGGVTTLRLRGIGADNTFNLPAQTPTLPPTLTIQVQGTGSTPTADVLNYTASFGAATTIDYATSTISQTGPTITPVTFSGVGVINEMSGGAGSTLTVIGAAGASTLNYTPTGANSGTVTLTGANPTINFSGVGSTFTLDGATAGVANQVYVDGTPLNDTFLIDEPTRTVTVTSPINLALPPVTLKPVVLGPNILTLSVYGDSGDDTFTVNPSPVANGLPVNIDGQGPEASDALIVNATAANQFTVVNQGRNPNSGTVRVYQSAVADPDISYTNVEIVDPNTFIPIGSPNAPNLLILGPDDYEENNYLNNAYFLGSGSTLQIQHAAIFPNATENGNNPGLPADQDFYQVVAQTTGTLDFQVYFQLYSPALFPGGGQLNIQVLNSAGQILAQSLPVPGTPGYGTADTAITTNGTGDRVRIPAIAGQSYYLRVFGANTDGTSNGTVVNGYNATIINTAAPVPYDIELSRSVASNISGSPDTGDLPPTAAADDTGRSQFDNVTNINDPVIYVHVDDGTLLQDLQGNQSGNTPPIGTTLIPFNTSQTLTPNAGGGFRVALFDDGSIANAPGLNPSDPTFLGFAQPVATPGYPHLYSLDLSKIDPAMAQSILADGINNITAEVQMVDPVNTTLTGFGARSAALPITVDTHAPPIQFGFLTSIGGPTQGTGLAAFSDSGVAGVGVLPIVVPPPASPSETTQTLSDKITNVEEPTFYGTAEANAIVTLYALDRNGNPVQLGQTTATPLDGTNADPLGQWTITSLINLNDPTYFNFDGLRHLYVTATDLAGNTNSTGASAPFGTKIEQLDILLDTTGPQVTGVSITGDPTYNLFGIKAPIGSSQGDAETNQGPTPLVNSIDINIQDLPAQVANFLREAIIVGIAETPGGITLTGDANGIIAIKSITVVPPAGSTVTPLAPGGLVPVGQIPTDTVRLTFYAPLPDDRYTLTINDTAIVDVAGNDLDGESNASQPNGNPTFPSGDGQPGGNFVARFTVDSRPEIGTYAASTAYIDANGNMVWDPNNTDATNRDLIFTLGLSPALQGQFSPFGIHDALTNGDYLNTYQIGVNAGPPPVLPLPGQQKIGYDKLAAYGYDPLADGGKGAFRWLIDTNSDGVINTTPFDPVSNPTGGDYAFAMAPGSQINGLPVSSDFALNQSAGDQIGLFNGTTWYLNTSTNMASFANAAAPGGSLQFSTPFLAGAPVVGDFDGAVTPSGAQIPDLATYQNGVFHIVFGQYNPITNSLFYVADAAHEATINMSFAGVGGIPVAADMDGDGITDLGVYQPPTTGITPQTGTWYWLISNDAINPATGQRPIPIVPDSVAALNHPFSPTPLGGDIFADFGAQSALPIVGNFDPPVTPAAAGPSVTALGTLPNTDLVANQAVSGQSWYSFTPQNSGTLTISTGAASTVQLALYDSSQNLITSGGNQVTNAVTSGTQYLVRVTGTASGIGLNFSNSTSTSTTYSPLDVNHDGVITPIDALAIINDLNEFGTHALAATPNNPEAPYDVNHDGMISPLDALAIINDLNAVAAALASGNSAVVSAVASPAASSGAGGPAPASASAAAGTSAAGPAIATSGSAPVSTAVPANVLAIDAVFAGLDTSSQTTTSSNLQSKGSASTLSSTTPVRKTSNTAGSSGAD